MADRSEAQAETSAEESLVAKLVDEFDLSVSEQLRLYELQAALARAGIEPTDPVFPRWLSPIFCSSPQEQAQFIARFQEIRNQTVADYRTSSQRRRSPGGRVQRSPLNNPKPI